ncbi:Hpt domain-containing protein [Roseinatronobacter alkalisoli]|uniref:Hpt domain-containing protein n=1 Tax=Roseinatronobacter alkalisoli TaxID=3028235 RepID=A0ABT5T546_9RHOB|nr:Hpt domain-containing protein [Roseinatronobacter sp. HJB301]MDD7970245.1 Hpt domain-containing protein [Roseinatronobacter sp. HJB301]
MPVIDWTRVQELYEEIGEDAFEEVLSLFVEEVDEALERLHAADTSAASMSEFHFLKGAALNLGLSEMAEVCSRGEKMSNDAAPTEAEAASVLTGFPSAIRVLQDKWRNQI